MTLQQLKYIVAINKHRSFAKAANECEISQPTLSAMLVKLEEELDVKIFDRTNKKVIPTTIGQRIIRQAEKTLVEALKINEIINEEKGQVSGNFDIAIGTTIAPYILPDFINYYVGTYPSVNLSIKELKTDTILSELQINHLDVGIDISDNKIEGILEIPLYTERFYVYLAESCWRKLPVFKPDNLEHEKMWIMKEAQCMRESAFSFCKARTKGNRIYEAGSIETLIRIVDKNGGFTIIPEMHLPFLSEQQRKNIRPIEGDYLSQRRISLYIKEDYIRQRMLNTVSDTLIKFIPHKMLDSHLVKFGIKL